MRLNGLTPHNVKDLAEALTTNKHLEELNISDNPLEGDDIQQLTHALSANQGVKKLYIQNCEITSLSESFAEALATNEHLEVLISIWKNWISVAIMHWEMMTFNTWDMLSKSTSN